jgi:hypothetical protein
MSSCLWSGRHRLALVWQGRFSLATAASLQGCFSPGLEQVVFLGKLGYRVDFGPWRGWNVNVYSFLKSV